MTSCLLLDKRGVCRYYNFGSSCLLLFLFLSLLLFPVLLTFSLFFSIFCPFLCRFLFLPRCATHTGVACTSPARSKRQRGHLAAGPPALHQAVIRTTTQCRCARSGELLAVGGDRMLHGTSLNRTSPSLQHACQDTSACHTLGGSMCRLHTPNKRALHSLPVDMPRCTHLS
jgi:hypothetical protein